MPLADHTIVVIVRCGSLRSGLRLLLPGVAMRVRAMVTMTGMSVPGMAVSVSTVSVAGMSSRTTTMSVTVVPAGQQVQSAVPQQGHRCKRSQQECTERPSKHDTLTGSETRLSARPTGKSMCHTDSAV